MNTNRGRAAAIVAGLAALLSSCGWADDGGASEAACSPDEKAAVQSMVKEMDPGAEKLADVEPDTLDIDAPDCRFTIGVVYPHFKDPYFLANAYGVEQAAKELGVTVKILAGQGYGDIPTQLSQVDNLSSQGVDAIILGAVDSLALGPTVDRLWEAGTPVIYNEISAQSEINVGSYTNDALSGELQADYIAENDPEAEVIAFCGPPGAAFGKDRCEAFKARLAEKAPNAEIVTEKYHDMDRAAIAQIAGNTIEAFPQATWIYNSTDLQAKGVVDALKAAGKKPGEIKVTNTTIGRELFGLLEEGWVSFALAERGVAQGSITLQRAVGVLNGQTELPAIVYSTLLGFTNSEEDLERFKTSEADLNWEPEGYTP